MKLKKKYNMLINKYVFFETTQKQSINKVIKYALQSFVGSCNNPALWCYGKHTKMLMADFMFEIKKIQYIIDAKYENVRESGFCIINKEQIDTYQIDGIVISSFVHREEIKETLRNEFPNLPYLDLYEELQKNGIQLICGYYAKNHPYEHYNQINLLKRSISSSAEVERSYQSIINEFVLIKDFSSAIMCAEELFHWKPREEYHCLIEDLKEIYQLELETLANLSKNNVLMLCIDGLRRQDVLGEDMPGLKTYLKENTLFYTNAYSVSTSTYESLVPAYSENSDLRTKYYESTQVKEKDCRFICEALRQNRTIHFYTDSTAYVDSDRIIVEDACQCMTEKLWSFISDAQNEDSGLFYVHILYESHYSYPNPDTESELVTDGSNIMFDYLDRNGGKLRTDYVKQHCDAIKYIDRVLTPFLKVLPCQMVLYADHGNILIPSGKDLSEVVSAKYSYHEDLIQIPFAIKSDKNGVGERKELLSLMSINEVVLDLLKELPFMQKKRDYIKIQRSEIYNPDFRYLYQKYGKEQELKAFEAFVFEEGFKLIIYKDGVIKLCTMDDSPFNDEGKKDELYKRVKKDISVNEVL